MVEEIKEVVADIEKYIKLGRIEGVIQEGEISINRRFTNSEINAIIQKVWFSDLIQSLRNRISFLEEKVKQMEK